MDILTLIILLVIALVVVGMAAAIMVNNEKVRKEHALAVIRGKGGDQTEKSSHKDAQDKRRAEIAKKLKEKGDDAKVKKKTTIAMQLVQAGLNWSVKRYWITCVVMSAVFFVGSKLSGMPGLAALLFGVAGFFSVSFYVGRKRKKRQKKFLSEFADALEAMVRLLKAGMPVTEAIAMAGREYTGPVGDEMLQIYEAQKVGIPMPEATLEAARRMPLTEMQMFATAIAIQAQTGASLSEVLMNLAGVIRARFKLKRKIIALSSEAKASAMIIGALPFLVGGGLFFINRDYIGLLFGTTIGQIMVAGSAVWMGIGIMVMKIMINFKI